MNKYSLYLFLLLFCLVGYGESAEVYGLHSTSSYPKNIYWGDLHLHTNLSIDANSWGKNKNLSPGDAYRFAKGETVIAHNGVPVALQRPLDFLVLADHSEGLGVMPALDSRDPVLMKVESGKSLFSRLDFINDNPNDFMLEMWFKDLELPFRQSVWQRVTTMADRHNQPGVFTSFIGFEWSPAGRFRGGLHRVVIFEGDSSKASKVLPFTSNQSEDPEDLWRYMANYSETTGGNILAIPHNSNVSKGEMFALTNSSNKPLDKAYAIERMRWEPVVEVTQIKGDSEAHPLLSPDDEFSDFETWNNWGGFGDISDDMSTAEAVARLKIRKQSSYIRPALKLGISQYASTGANPFKFGLVGATDSHTSLSTADDDNFWGKVSIHEPSPKRLLTPYREDWLVPAWKSAASGYTAIWAEENTREALFAALKRKEVYATTGPRIRLRFFAGWDYQEEDAYKPDMARIGYEGGVPMGGDLTHVSNKEVPHFLIRAVKDPEGANLDRIQVIKGWLDKKGQLQEKIYNVVLSDGREGKGLKTKRVGSTVDIFDASYVNTIGAPELATVWQDPDFNKDEAAFYYLRVLEIPTPRWTAYDAKYFALKDLPDDIPMITQERAYSSPIWYTP